MFPRNLKLLASVIFASAMFCFTGFCFTGATHAQQLQSEAVSIAPNEAREWKFIAPEVPAGQAAAISFEARLDSAPGGSMYFMDIRLNGQPISAAINRLRTRLRNKPLVVAPDKPLLLWNLPGGGWRVLYAPDFSATHHDIYGPEAFRFVIEVGDLLKAGENTLSINRLPIMHQKPLVVQNLQLTTVPVGEESTQALPRAGATPEAGAEADGSLVIKAGSLRLPISTSFSVPGGGWKRFGPPISLRDGETAAQVARIGPGGTARYSFKDARFAVDRTVIAENGHAKVHDLITNTTDQDIGMMMRREMALPSKVPAVYLGGDDNPSSSTSMQPQHPTIFVPFADFSVGLVDEDDAMRAQGIRAYDAAIPAVSTRTERLVIPAKGTITLSWSVYASTSTDYFDFLNRVRSDWGVNNVTIPGPWWWGFQPEQIIAMSDEELRTWIKRTETFAVVSGGGWVDRTKKEPAPAQIGFGVGVMEPQFSELRADFKQAADKIHRVVPGVKFVIYNHMFFNEPESDPEQFRDSWITRADGSRHQTGWGGDYTVSRGIYPTTTNSFGPAFRAALEAQKRELGADGFYIDESNYPSGLTADPVTYNAWDGRSAILDPKTFAIKQKIGYVYLLSEAYQNNLIKEMDAHGTWFMGNDAPMTNSQNRASWPRFVETHQNIRRGILSQLYTPLAFGSRAPSVEVLRRNLEFGVLHSVTGPNDLNGIVGKFFPITPTELHSGWVKGKERIVTSRSGNFGWENETFRYRIWSYRADGTPVEAAPQWQSGKGLIAVAVPQNGIAILEREM